MLFIRYLKYLSKQPLSLKGSIQERETLTSLKNEGNEIQFQPNCWAIFHASLTPPQNSGQVKGTLESGRCTDLLERGRQWGYCLVKDSTRSTDNWLEVKEEFALFTRNFCSVWTFWTMSTHFLFNKTIRGRKRRLDDRLDSWWAELTWTPQFLGLSSGLLAWRQVTTSPNWRRKRSEGLSSPWTTILGRKSQQEYFSSIRKTSQVNWTKHIDFLLRSRLPAPEL